MLATGPAALAAAVGDSNAGDVWVDTAGAPPGPGHEMDPHLPCANITVWGAKLADPSGSYVVDGWPPSGSQEQDYSSTWAYNTATGGTQAISTINITMLINTAAANGDKPAAQGYHFKLAVSQDPSKYKTFWVKCAPPTTSSSPTGSSPSPTGTSPSTTGTSPSPTGNIPSTTGVRPNQPNRVPGTKKKTHHKKHHPHLVPPPHRHHVKTTHIKKKLTTTAAFTG